MAQIANSLCVLAVRDLDVSTRYYMDVLGFRKEPINAPGWSFLARDLYQEFVGNGALVSSKPTNKPWGLREFGLSTPDGHGIVCGEEI
jgi:hypothetical protein